MEYLAKIIQEQKSENRLFYKYTFVNLETGQENYFLNNYQIDYFPDLAGRLKIKEVEDNTNQCLRIFQSFKQDTINTTESFKNLETLIQLEKEWKESIKEEEKRFVGKKKIKLAPQEIEWLRKKGLSWQDIREFCGVSEWTIRRWRKEEPNRPKQKRGRKEKVNGNTLPILYSYIDKNNTSTQAKMIDYLYQKLGLKVNQSTISRTLKRVGITYKKATIRYSEQKSRIKDIVNFANYFKFLIFPCEELLALDECSFHLNEALGYAYSRKGSRASIWKPGNKGSNYTLILCIQNVKEKGVIHYQLIEGGVKSQSFHDFLQGINLPANESSYRLWLDNAKVHHSTYACQKLGLPTVREKLNKKGIWPNFLPPYTPQLNPVELCFNIIGKYVNKHEPRTFEELKLVIDRAIINLQQKDLSRFFWHCLNFNLY